MRIEEILGKPYSPRLSVYLEGIKKEDLPEIAGMLRGLMCSIEGWGSISGITNDEFSTQNPLILEFSSPDNADYFKRCVEYYFDGHILEALKVNKRVYRNRT